MPISSVHPLFTDMQGRWIRGEDSYQGEDKIKASGTTYLPATSGQLIDGQGKGSSELGEKAYQAYKLRAIYPTLYKDAVEAAIGIMHREPPNIELPKVLEPMRENATLLSEGLEMLLRNINTQQLMTGRLGILGDIRVDREKKTKPVILTYNAQTICNWDDSDVNGTADDVRLVVLDESGWQMDDAYNWSEVEKYRVLSFADKDGIIAKEGVYGSAVFTAEMSLPGVELKVPQIMGNELKEIPFAFINSKDLSPTPDSPPLEGLAQSCLAIYRGEADYRQNLFMQGQDTLVRIGINDDDEKPVRTGAGARIDVPLNGDAKYIGVSSNGLSEQRTALENDYQRAIQKAGQTLDSTSKAKESGEALRIRVSAQTATLPQIAHAGAKGLEKVLKALARWYGANEDEVVVTPNLNFTEADLNGKTLVEIMQAKGLGAPISEESIHEWLQKQGFTAMDYKSEVNLLSQEEPLPGKTIPSSADEE